MDATTQQYQSLIRSAARRLKGHQRRLFQAEVAIELCAGNPRAAERRFGWGRDAVATGLDEARTGLRCAENFPARGRLPCEVLDPQLAAAVRSIVEPHTLADPEVKSPRRYTNLSAGEVRQALADQKGYSADRLPSERTMRDVLNRMGYRLERIQKARPLKKLPQTSAVFENVKAAHEKYKNDGLEIRLVYYPAYHSKYNPIEHCWGILEQKWGGTLLNCLDVILQQARRMTWKGKHPEVMVQRGDYPDGVCLSRAQMKPYEKRMQRSKTLPKYDITILPLQDVRQVD